MSTLVAALQGLTEAVQNVVVELRLQRVAIAKIGALRELDKEAVDETIDQLGQRVVQQERAVNRLALVRPPAAPFFPPDEPPTKPDGQRPPIPRYPRRP
jgi:hypothetical protein